MPSALADGLKSNILNTDHKKRIAILGSTGSIGTQALEVIEAHPESFELEVLTANHNAKLLIAQALAYKPNAVVIANDSLYDEVFEALDPHDIKVYAGANALNSIVEMETIDLVLTAMVGYAGLQPTIRAINAGKTIALANKETLVVAGELITKLAQEKGVNIYPVDSEHSAIFSAWPANSITRSRKLFSPLPADHFAARTKPF